MRPLDEQPQDQPTSMRDDMAYLRASRMLDRYGITYVYFHPEILLGIVPGTTLAERIQAAGAMQMRHRPAGAALPPLLRPVALDELLDQIIESYQWLNGGYSAHRAPEEPYQS